MTNYYDLLGVARDASEAAIRDRFRQLARSAHPDRYTEPDRKREAEQRFQLLTEAVNVLTNETRRKAHDFDLDKTSGAGTHDPQAVAKVYLAKGVKAYRENDFEQAVMLFDMAVKHYDKDPKSLHYLALACQHVPREARKGAAAIEGALKLEPMNGVFHREAAKLYMMVGLTAKAERHLDEALKWIPDDAEARRLLAEIRPGADSGVASASSSAEKDEPRVTISAFGLTDVGRKRRHNEDAYLLDVERGLFVVADGMGGHAAGEVASRITVESIQEFIAGTEEEHENTWPFGFNNRYSLEGNRLTTAVEKANEKVMRAVHNRPELKGMGTTVVAALFDQERVTLVHVGDSRAYLYRETELKRLTDDHSWVQEQVNAGILSEDEAKSHPLKNVVTRALGGAAHVAVDLIEVPITAGDRFLLCSDGLTGMVSDEEIVEHLSVYDPPDRIVRSLVELANERGGVDNITAILVEVGRNAGDHRPTDPIGIEAADVPTESTAVTISPASAQPQPPKVSPADEETETLPIPSGSGDDGRS